MNKSNTLLSKNNYQVYIPREKIFNQDKQRKHRNKNFRKIFYYVNKRQYSFNEDQIKEIDITGKTELQFNVIYKHIYKSKTNKFFDIYYKLKDEYKDCKEIYIEKHNAKPRISYNENLKSKIKFNYFNDKKQSIKEKLTLRFN